MSAFIVDHAHINALVSYMVSKQVSYWTGKTREYVTRNNAEEVGRILLDENVRSVNYRYRDECDNDEKNQGSTYCFSYSLRPLSPVQVIKAVNCLVYQSCETEDWESTIAWRICQAIISHAVHDLRGYDEAAWEIP